MNHKSHLILTYNIIHANMIYLKSQEKEPFITFQNTWLLKKSIILNTNHTIVHLVHIIVKKIMRGFYANTCCTARRYH